MYSCAEFARSSRSLVPPRERKLWLVMSEGHYPSPLVELVVPGENGVPTLAEAMASFDAMEQGCEQELDGVGMAGAADDWDNLPQAPAPVSGSAWRSGSSKA